VTLSAAPAFELAARAAALHADALIWDQHGCLPLRPDESAVDELELYQRAGVDVVSINVGFDLTSPLETLKVAAAFRRGILERSDRYLLIDRYADVEVAKATGRLAVSFDLEGTEPLDGQLSLLSAYHVLGVRTMLIAYNQRNRAGGGCHGDAETGLTGYGRALVREMNDLGMLVDATHCSRRTVLDLFDESRGPVVFSHSVPLGVRRHERNVSDDLMRAAAAAGGVIGINGVGIFLGENDASTESLTRAVVYAVELVGSEHVGIGLDYVFDQDELNTYVSEHRDTFPPGSGYGEYFPHRFVSPLQLPELTRELLARGYHADAVRAILGGNFARVARLAWS
jgi:membrane dipeptidase